ncbi:acyl-CoA dehydrogenase [Kibdelosporangium philippinense]|uniref:Acyl-CoA dehydrogenase n=1 Tax=Kibdelosporangium philippinense TaxID=211113 RepID=A0ABS8Z4T0_9PSEU|nr:acyl-CoA dehydrogenase family protein [Kibdelosporangium philippinense]MCE7002850.1 acyl-CoA dehydrogenase [Kibdelosporangium philippinense]
MSGLHVSDEFDTVIAGLDAVSPIILANADTNDEQAGLTKETIKAVHESGIFKASIPHELGGYELSPTQLIELIAKVSYLDASVGWICNAMQTITGSTAAFLGQEGVEELYPDVANDQFALVAGQGTRFGTATRAEGGFLLTGQWSFVSGMALASHLLAVAPYEPTGQLLVLIFPKSEVTVVDNWDVMGLRATGSIDYHCENLFVPDSRIYDLSTAKPRIGGAFYELGSTNTTSIGHAGWALGVGTRMLDEMKKLAEVKTGHPGAAVDTSQFYAEYAQAEAKLRSSVAWTREVWQSNEATVDKGDPLSTEQQTTTKLMQIHVTTSIQEVGLTVYKWAATAALRRGDLQRFFRDLHAGTQHVTSGPVVLQNCGKWLSGLAPTAHWEFMRLLG